MIIHIISSLYVGGAERALEKLLLNQKSKNNDVLVVSLTELGYIGKSLQKSGYQVEVIDFRNFSSSPLAIYRLFCLIKKNRPKIVQTWLYHADFIGGVLAKLAGVSVVFWGVRTTELKPGSPGTVIIRKLCSLLSSYLPTKIICVADSVKRKHIEIGYSAEKMQVIPNGFDTNKFIFCEKQRSHYRRVLKLEGKVVIGSIARFSEDKAHDVFIEAVSRVVKYFPEMKIVMLGTDIVKENKKLQSWVSKHRLENYIVFQGEVAETSDLLSAFDIFCLHSRTEGFPNVLGEAMSSSLPCVSTDVGDAKVIIENTGVIVRPNDIEHLASGLLKLLRMSKSSRHELGKKARLRIEQNYSLNKTIKEYESLYRTDKTKGF